jgi:hypothetical protein
MQFAKLMKLKRKEDQSVDTLFLLRRGSKIPTKGVTETKSGAETKVRTIQRLPHPGIYPIYKMSHSSVSICALGMQMRKYEPTVYALRVPNEFHLYA